MTVRRCDQLDDYLCGWLSPDEAAAYEAHLVDCGSCREECASQRRIDRLLAEAGAATAPVPAGLRSRVDGRVRAARRRRMLGWAGAVTAAGLAIAFGIWTTKNTVFLPREGRDTTQHASSEDHHIPSVAPPAGAVPPAVAVQVTMIDPSSAIAMPVESRHPDVTLIRIFPTIGISGVKEP